MQGAAAARHVLYADVLNLCVCAAKSYRRQVQHWDQVCKQNCVVLLSGPPSAPQMACLLGGYDASASGDDE